MTRKFSEHSYQYIQGWLKTKYKNDPKFKQERKDNGAFYYLKKVITKKIDILTLDIIAECYMNHLF